jgi:hypothetical protein
MFGHNTLLGGPFAWNCGGFPTTSVCGAADISDHRGIAKQCALDIDIQEILAVSGKLTHGPSKTWPAEAGIGSA